MFAEDRASTHYIGLLRDDAFRSERIFELMRDAEVPQSVLDEQAECIDVQWDKIAALTQDTISI